MLPYGGKDLAAAFRTVRKNTIQISEEIPEAKYDFQPAPDTRTVRQLLLHLAVIDRLQRVIHGERRTTVEEVDFPGFLRQITLEEQAPRSKDEILELLKSNGDTFASFLEGLSDDFLAERIAMRQGMQPPHKTRFEMLMGVKEHEMHHRGQLMLMERLLGLTPHLTRQMREWLAART
jgi:uncharacterized damage-inducible protein DinB